MKKSLKYIFSLATIAASLQADAQLLLGAASTGGRAGATELLINPFARSSGFHGANQSYIKGAESMFLNVGGLAYTDRTEFVLSRTSYLLGTGINILNMGFSQNLGGDNVLGVSVMNMDMGEIQRTTTEQPDGGIGTYRPQFLNIGVAYSRRWTKNLYGGALVRVISESIVDVKAQGIALDAGIQYRAILNKSKEKIKGRDLHFGIAIRNLGPDMSFSGDGLSIRTINPLTGISSTTEQRAASFSLPTIMSIAGAYDIRLDRNEATYNHKLTASAMFVSHTSQQNQTTVGLEYGYKGILMLRSGFQYEKDIFNKEERKTFNTGLALGATVEVPLVKKDKLSNATDVPPRFAIDYSYRTTNPFNGIHTIGLRLDFGSKKSR